MKIVTEREFAGRLRQVLESADMDDVGFVTGPGRSGAIASVYASHLLRVPFIPYGSTPPVHLGRALIIDTARETGATLRKAERRYEAANPIVLVCFEEPPRVAFWYEAPKPQLFRHETRKVA
jgi:hypothetical protein